jgi:GT2 family glycosyltransferase/glycosyltransferase involved in cell wall biosynthesis
MTTQFPYASIVIPNYNGAEHLETCLASLHELRYPGGFETIIADNASTDGSVDLVKRRFPDVKVVELEANLGFAAACNRGARDAQGGIVAFLNNDMRVEPSWLTALVEPLLGDPDVVATSARILSWDGKAIDFVGGSVNFYGHGFQPRHGRPAAELGDDSNRPVLFACGGSMAARKDVFLASGAFDEDYFAFFEDIDLGWRFWVLGYRVLFVPSAVAYHKGHATGSKLPAHQIRVLYERNALATVIKNYDDANLARVLPVALLLAAERALVYGQVDRRGYRVWAKDLEKSESIERVGVSHVLAMAEVAEHAEALWAKRAIVQAHRRRADSEIFGLLEAPFETNCLDVAYMSTQKKLQEALGIEEMFARASTEPRVLIISNDTVNARMAGPGIRAWEMANVLAGGQSVTLAVPNDDPPPSEHFQVKSYRSKSGVGLRELAAEHDVLIVQGFVLHLFPFLAELDKVLIVDLYDPFTLENLHVFSHDPMDQRNAVHESHLDVLNAQLRAGDFFLCASEKQRDYWLGMLAANNRINPQLYDVDPTLRRLIDVVPFGMPSDPPRPTRRVLKGVYPGIAADDRVILWGGGIWEWFDPLTLIQALDRIRDTRPEVKLFFMGIKHPNPLVPDMAMTARAIALAKELGLDGKSVFFNEWVPYDERQNYLLESDIGVSLHFDHLETRYSFRTRVLDYIWAGLPVVCSRGDAVGELVETRGLGRVVDYQDVDELVEALLEILDDPKGRAARAERFRTAADELRWEQALAPLAHFCADPHRAPDRAALLASIDFGPVEQRYGRWSRTASSLLPPGPPPTPVWRLPLRAITYVRTGGMSRLWREARSYVRWRQLRAEDQRLRGE